MRKKSAFTSEERLYSALSMVLDHVDYTAKACALTEMVGAVLPKDVIEIARTVLAECKPRSHHHA